METLKLIVDVEADGGVTREAAIEAALKEARASDEVLALAVKEIRPRYARYQKKENVWQVMAEVIEKEAEFPPKGIDGDDGGDDLPKKIDDAVSDDEDKKDDEGDVKGMLMDIQATLAQVLDAVGGGEEPTDLPPVGGPPAKKVGPPKPPMMSSAKVARYLPKHAAKDRREARASAQELLQVDPELRGYRFARLHEDEVQYTAEFVRA